jgi:hypothetical protein
MLPDSGRIADVRSVVVGRADWPIPAELAILSSEAGEDSWPRPCHRSARTLRIAQPSRSLAGKRMETNGRACMKQGSKWPDSLLVLVVSLLIQSCSSKSSPTDGGTDVLVDAPSGRAPTPLVVSVAQPVPRSTSWSVNYWRWMPDYGDHVTGTAELIKALKPAFLRVGGYNNDVNLANPFDHAARPAAWWRPRPVAG